MMGERTRELLLLIIGDAICFAVSLWLTLLIRYIEIPTIERLMLHIGPFLLLTGVWLLIFLSAGLYDKHTTLLKQALRNRIVFVQITNMVLAAVLFLIIPFGIAPKLNLAIYLVISTALLSWWRIFGVQKFAPTRRQKAILIADGAEAISLVDEINNNERYNYSFVRLIDVAVATKSENFEERLLQLIEREDISIIVAEKESAHAAEIMPVIFDRSFLQFQLTFLDFTTLYEDTFDRVPLPAIGYNWFITEVSQSKNLLYDFGKRIMDVVGATVLLLATVPIFIATLLAIKVEDGGPAMYTTTRTGVRGTPITLYKFRTKNGRDTAQAALHSTLVDTKVGTFLRKTRIDELPQLYNVLRGDLSFIGPRPEIPSLAAVYNEQIPYYSARHMIKPGLSGWAQINDFDAPRGGVDVERTTSKLSYDLLYLKRRSFMFDVQIAIKTLTIVLLRTGS